MHNPGLPRSVASVLNANVPDHQQAYRRSHLRVLDGILAELEMLNLGEAPVLPRSLGARLRRAGVPHHQGARVSELIDLVFRAQEAYLQPMPATTTGRRSAA